MVHGWSSLSTFIYYELIGGWIFTLWIPFDGMFIVELNWVFTYPSEVFQVVYHCLPFSPFQWPLVIFYYYNEIIFITFFSKMFMRSRNILPRIFKSIYFHLIGFWESWLFNYPLTSILHLLTLNLRYWHETNGITSLDVWWVYVSNISSILWGNPKLLVRQYMVPNLGINGGEGKWARMFPNVLNQLSSGSWVSLCLPSCI